MTNTFSKKGDLDREKCKIPNILGINFFEKSYDFVITKMCVFKKFSKLFSNWKNVLNMFCCIIITPYTYIKSNKRRVYVHFSVEKKFIWLDVLWQNGEIRRDFAYFDCKAWKYWKPWKSLKSLEKVLEDVWVAKKPWKMKLLTRGLGLNCFSVLFAINTKKGN